MRTRIDGIAILDERKRFKYLDQSFAELYGFQDPPQLIGRPWNETYSKLHLRRFKREILPGLSEGKSWSGVISGLKKNGSRFSQQISAYELGTEGLVFLVKNIAPEGRQAFEVGEPGRNWPWAVESPPEVVTVISPDFEILEINSAGAERLGKSAERLKGEKCYEIVHGLSSPIRGCPCRKTLETGSPGVGEVSEDELEYVVTAYPLLDESEELTAFLHTVTEVHSQPPGRLKACEFFFRRIAQLDDQSRGRSFLADSVQELVGSSKISIYERNGDRLECLLQRGYRRPLEGEELCLDAGGVRTRAFREDRSIYLSEVAGNESFIRYNPEVKSEFVAPISTPKGKSGVVDVRGMAPEPFTPTERNLIEIMAAEFGKFRSQEPGPKGRGL